ncbi:MAG: hypothetical protein NDI61_08420 [Bdellovibrionaceae bacterium]|nr:hypothetical protein [Pseudobdellovibrionaceae bacterium]
MEQKHARYHSAFIELAKGSEIRPLRSRRGLVLLATALTIVALGSGLFSYSQYVRSRGPAAATVEASALTADIPEVAAPADLSPDMIEKMQERLHDSAD